MMAIEMMYQQCILGTMDEIVATTTVMTPMILTIKTLSTVCYGLVSIIAAQYCPSPKCSIVSRAPRLLHWTRWHKYCRRGNTVETVGDTKTNKARRHFCSKYTTRQIGGLLIDWTFFAALSMKTYPVILVCNLLVWLFGENFFNMT